MGTAEQGIEKTAAVLPTSGAVLGVWQSRGVPGARPVTWEGPRSRCHPPKAEKHARY